MSETKVVKIKPDPQFIESMETLLEQAKSGALKSLFGTGIMADGNFSHITLSGPGINIASIIGSLEVLKNEIISKITLQDVD